MEIGSDFDGSRTAISIIRKSAVRLVEQEGVSRLRQSDAISSFIAKRMAEGAALGVEKVSQQTWNKFAKTEAKYIPTNRGILLAAWGWMHEAFPKIIHDEKWKSRLIQGLPPSALVSVIHNQILPERALMADVMSMSEGVYALCRPHQADRHKIVVERLECVEEGGYISFNISSPSSMDDRSSSSLTVDGFVIPYDGGILFQGRLVEIGGPYILVAGSLDLGYSVQRLYSCEGFILAGANGAVPVVYPFLLFRRASEDVETGVFSMAEIRLSPLWKYIKNKIKSWKTS